VETWTKVGEHFYAYRRMQRTAIRFWKPRPDLPALRSLRLRPPIQKFAVCVPQAARFHRVSLQEAGTAEAVDFDFLEKRGGGEARRSGKGPAKQNPD